MASHGNLKTRQLAKRRGRDRKNVHNDVTALVEPGMLDKDGRDVLSALYDTRASAGRGVNGKQGALN